MNEQELSNILETNKKSCFLYVIRCVLKLHPTEVSMDELCIFMEVINKTNYPCEGPHENNEHIRNKNEKEHNEPPKGYRISIPNIVFDYWLHVLSPEDFKVFICFFRNEFCEGNLWRAYVEQIEMFTGLDNGDTNIFLKSLHTNEIIIKVPNYTKNSKNDDKCFAVNINTLYKGI